MVSARADSYPPHTSRVVGSVSAVTSLRPLRAAVVVAYVVPTAFGAAILRILGSPLLRLLVLQRAAAAAIELAVAAAAAIASAAIVAAAAAASSAGRLRQCGRAATSRAALELGVGAP